MPGFAISDGSRWPLGRFPALAAEPDLVHAVTTRAGPDFGSAGVTTTAASASAELARELGLRGAAWARQVHGATVRRVAAAGSAGEADALVTDEPGLLLIGRSADCPLVLACGRRADGTAAVGFAHASWRATVARITARMIDWLTGELAVAPGTLRAAIAPSAGPCCYEVGPEVRQQALAALGADASRFFLPHGWRDHFDLWSVNVAQLLAGGVPADSIEVSEVCTICQGDRFWSWRRQQSAAGRFAAAIGIRAEGP